MIAVCDAVVTYVRSIGSGVACAASGSKPAGSRLKPQGFIHLGVEFILESFFMELILGALSTDVANRANRKTLCPETKRKTVLGNRRF